MDQAENFLGGGVIKSRGAYHHLAECIRRGCKLRPKKVRRYLRRGEQMACALGAAAAGVENRRAPEKYSWPWLHEIFPELGRRLTHPLAGIEMSLGQIVCNLNDQTSYSREAIADWLCRVGGCQHQLAEEPINPPRGGFCLCALGCMGMHDATPTHFDKKLGVRGADCRH